MLKKMYRTFVIARTAQALSTLSDRQLADIGIERHQIFQHAEKSYA